MIQFEPIWSSLIHFGQIWSNLIQNKMAIFIQFVNVTTLYRNIFWLLRNPIWASLIKFDLFWTDLIQKNPKENSHFYPFCKCENFLYQHFWVCASIRIFFRTDAGRYTDIQVKIVSRLDILFDHTDLSQNIFFFISFYRLIDLILSWRENLQQRLMTSRVLWN